MVGSGKGGQDVYIRIRAHLFIFCTKCFMFVCCPAFLASRAADPALCFYAAEPAFGVM